MNSTYRMSAAEVWANINLDDQQHVIDIPYMSSPDYPGGEAQEENYALSYLVKLLFCWCLAIIP